MKEYTKPEITVIQISNTDVVTLSGGIVKSKFSDSKGYSEIKF